DPTRNGLDLRKWTTVLQNCRDEPTLWNRLGLPYGALDRFRQSRNIDEYQRRQKEGDAHSLSDWDLHLTAPHLYDDNLYHANAYAEVADGPGLYIVPTIRAYQGLQFWAWVLKSLHPAELDRLWQEARRIVEQEELRSARELPHPSVLEICP